MGIRSLFSTKSTTPPDIVSIYSDIDIDVDIDIEIDIEIENDDMPTPMAKIRKEYKNHTDKIKENPHDPKNWNERAKWFNQGCQGEGDEKNRWPFLAAGDAYKVHEWFCDAKFRRQNGLYLIPDGELIEMKLDAWKILVQALLDLGDVEMAKAYYGSLGSPLGEEGGIKINRPLEFYRPIMRNHRYAWIPAPFMDRKKYLKTIKEDLAVHGLALRNSKVGDFNDNNLGIFATKRFEQGDILFREQTFRASSPQHNNDVVTYFYDAAIRELNKGAPRNLLNHPNIGALTASYSDNAGRFRFCDDIVFHLEYLKEKDPKLLWNLDFDMWVLHTAQRRCSVNAFGFDKIHEDGTRTKWSVISSKASLFQHSCEPNAAWRNENGGLDTMIVTADRDIEEGEEIYDSYCDLGKNLEGRRQVLRHWIGCDCKCTRCVREEKAKAEKDAREADSGVEVMDSETSSSSSSEVEAGGDAAM
ncbi:hypothetical protein E2P81_ATG02903 [Venturia nashicola]|nr:hypothetical protein E2P81_ATG02903 [Venturia nashicola]